MNVFCIVGKIKELPGLKETVNGIKTCTVTVEIERPFANSEGIYESDEVIVEVWRGLAETVCNACKEGDWLSIKGRISSSRYERNNHSYLNYVLIAEKIGFLK